MNRWVLAALAVLLAPGSAPGQGAAPRGPVFRVGVETVHVTVTVQDKDGRCIADLRPDEFVVLEDGRPQPLELVARAVEPGNDEALVLDLGLLLDTSESMMKEMKLSQEAAVRFLENIPRARELFTIFFDEDIRISRYDSENQQGLFERIHDTKSAGNTALYDAIAVYISRIEESPGRKVLVVLTDGEDSISRTSFSEVVRLIRSSPVTIYPIALLGGFPSGSARTVQARAVLQQLAEVSGGQVFSPGASRDLAAIFQKILDELKAQYVLGYVPANAIRDGRFRKLKVQVKRDRLRVRHRAGYFASAAAGE
ncbi:MAG TPA: VWA domain-containing protein [Vicinamibacteria bacterium]